MRLPDPKRSQIVLIGASTYTDKDLLNVSVVDRTIADLAAALTDPDYGVVPASKCAMLVNEGDLRELGRQLRSAANRAEDLLLVYYTGHGLLGSKRKELYLALPDSESAAPEFNSLEYDKVRDAVLDSPAQTKVIILDCCFSGRSITGMMTESTAGVMGQIEVDGTYILTSAPQYGVALFLPGEEHTAFTGRLLRLLDEGIPNGPDLLTIDDMYQALRISMKAEGLPEPQKSSTRTAHLLALTRNGQRATFYRALKRSLREGIATRQEMLNFFSEQEPRAVERWLHASDMTNEMRERALSLVLSHLDNQAVNVVTSNWGTVAEAVSQLITRNLSRGDITIGAWCLDTLSQLPGRAEDRLLAELLVPRQDPSDWQQYMNTQIKLLKSRDLPGLNTFRDACSALQSHDQTSWGAYLVRELLNSEMGNDPSHQRVVAWMNWICLGNRAPHGRRPHWVVALNCVLAAHTNETLLDGSEVLILDEAWAVTILKLAMTLGCLPKVLEQLERSIRGLAIRLTSVSVNSSTPPSNGNRKELLWMLNVSMWQQNVPAQLVAIVDIVRILLGGHPRDFPREGKPVMLDGYADGLAYALRDASVQVQNHLQRAMLKSIIDGRDHTRTAVWLLNLWSADPELSPYLLDYLAELPENSLPFSEQLSSSFWSALTRNDRLAGYASVRQLMTATREAAINPETLLRTVRESGLCNTELALACYSSHQARLSIKGIIRAMGVVLRPFGDGGERMIEPRALDNVLREFQVLTSFESGDDLPPVSDHSPMRPWEENLYECWDLVIHGAFGRDFGAAFAIYLDERLQDDIKRRQRMLSVIDSWHRHLRRRPLFPVILRMMGLRNRVYSDSDRPRG